jgi:hypothetical protein
MKNKKLEKNIPGPAHQEGGRGRTAVGSRFQVITRMSR